MGFLPFEDGGHKKIVSLIMEFAPSIVKYFQVKLQNKNIVQYFHYIHIIECIYKLQTTSKSVHVFVARSLKIQNTISTGKKSQNVPQWKTLNDRNAGVIFLKRVSSMRYL